MNQINYFISFNQIFFLSVYSVPIQNLFPRQSQSFQTIIEKSLVSALPQLRLDYALASISCEHCHSSHNNPHCAPRHVIYYFIATVLTNWFSVPVKRDETTIFNPTGENLKVGLQTALSPRFTGTENQIVKTVAMK